MAEIKTEVKPLKVGVAYTPTNGDYLITEDHTLSDIARFLIAQSGGDAEHVKAIVDFAVSEESNG